MSAGSYRMPPFTRHWTIPRWQNRNPPNPKGNSLTPSMPHEAQALKRAGNSPTHRNPRASNAPRQLDRRTTRPPGNNRGGNCRRRVAPRACHALRPPPGRTKRPRNDAPDVIEKPGENPINPVKPVTTTDGGTYRFRDLIRIARNAAASRNQITE
jgi:hypothetical protein